MTIAVTPETISHDAEAAELELYGITRVRADTYHVGGYRYGKLADAVAQAKRAERGTESGT